MKKFAPMPLATHYCVGHGIELGAAAHNPFDLPDCTFIAPCDGKDYLYQKDMDDYRHYVAHNATMVSEEAPIHAIGDFQHIPKENNSIDYIVTSHVIEHAPNTIAAFVESSRVLKNGGIFFCIFPKRNAWVGDVVRPLTSLDDMITTFDRGITMADMPHETWRGHYQVFSLQSMIRCVNYMNQAGLGSWLIEAVEETDSKVGNGHTIVLRKYDDLHLFKTNDVHHFNDVITQQIEDHAFDVALSLVKSVLSFHFFSPETLYKAAFLSAKVNQLHQCIHFLQQALILDPENEKYRQEFYQLTNVGYTNPVL